MVSCPYFSIMFEMVWTHQPVGHFEHQGYLDDLQVDVQESPDLHEAIPNERHPSESGTGKTRCTPCPGNDEYCTWKLQAVVGGKCFFCVWEIGRCHDLWEIGNICVQEHGTAWMGEWERYSDDELSLSNGEGEREREGDVDTCTYTYPYTYKSPSSPPPPSSSSSSYCLPPPTYSSSSYSSSFFSSSSSSSSGVTNIMGKQCHGRIWWDC